MSTRIPVPFTVPQPRQTALHPLVDRGPIPEELIVHARRAADACPKLALALRPDAA
jgi:ferredoxin